jgi:hypothetical protein
MSGSEEILTSYLIKLGYKVDNLQKQAFDSAAGKAGAVVSKAMTIGMTAVTALTGVMAGSIVSMDKLYQASLRAGSSMTQFRAMTGAFEQVGGSAEEMSNALVSIGAQLRNTTQGQVMADFLGLQNTLDATEALTKFVDKYHEFRAEQLKANPQSQENVLRQTFLTSYGGMLGASPQVLDQILLRTQAFKDSTKARLADMAAAHLTDQSMRASAEAVSRGREAVSQLTDALYEASGHALPDINDGLHHFSEWFQTHPKEIKEDIAAIGEAFKITAQVIVGGAKAIDWFARSASKVLHDPIVHTLIEQIKEHARHGAPLPAPAGVSVPEAASRAPAGLPSGAAASRMSSIANMLGGMGLNKVQVSGVLGSLQGESPNFDPNARNPIGGDYGFAQWTSGRRGDFKRQYGKDMHGSSFEEQRDFMRYELTHGFANVLTRLKGARTPADAARFFTEGYERPGVPRLEQRQANANAIYQTINVNVSGSNASARDIGKETGAASKRAIHDAYRGFNMTQRGG